VLQTPLNGQPTGKPVRHQPSNPNPQPQTLHKLQAGELHLRLSKHVMYAHADFILTRVAARVLLRCVHAAWWHRKIRERSKTQTP